MNKLLKQKCGHKRILPKFLELFDNFFFFKYVFWMHQNCVLWQGTGLKMERLRDLIITLIIYWMYLTNVHLLSEELALCH